MGFTKVFLEPMQKHDIDEIMVIEHLSFPTAWPSNAFQTEIDQNQLGHYVVARLISEEGVVLPPVVGYAGVWIVIDEVHVTTIAVHPEQRGKRIGEQLLYYLLSYGINKNAKWATLEVRESNKDAQTLYKKYGFSIVGVRKNYYAEEGENAVIMWAGNLQGEIFKERLHQLAGKLMEKTC